LLKDSSWSKKDDIFRSSKEFKFSELRTYKQRKAGLSQVYPKSEQNRKSLGIIELKIVIVPVWAILQTNHINRRSVISFWSERNGWHRVEQRKLFENAL
jgi:hypothetical protein